MKSTTHRFVGATVFVTLIAGSCGLVPPRMVFAEPAPSADSAQEPDLTGLELEDLMAIEITSVSKKPERLGDSPAAIYVLTQEDLRRSGATSIAEALRMVPGVEVAQISANRWAVTVRGFNGAFANKLLVLMDGRSVYTPLFSGVFWDVQDTLLEDVDRIEIVRGPGATLWGANAVNGVINIITKPAEETQGVLVSGGLGTEERRFGAARWGAALGDSAHYRVYAKYFHRDDFVDADGERGEDGGSGEDEWDVARGGFRLDWDPGASDQVTLQGDYYRGDIGERSDIVTSLVPPRRPLRSYDVDIVGGDLLARWTHRFSETSQATLQSYYDRTERETLVVDELRDTFDLDFQHGFALGSRQEILWGLGYRMTKDRVRTSFGVSFHPDKRRDHLFQGFLQDQVEILRDRLRLTLGSKFEHNEYSGFEYQPSGRLLFTPHQDHVFWGSVSRAVRTPSRADAHVAIYDQLTSETFSEVIPVRVPTGFPPPFDFTTVMVPVSFPFSSVVQIVGDSDFDSERLLAFEMGYRFRPAPRFSLDVAAFYNEYDRLRSNEPGVTDTSVLEAAVPGFTMAALGAGPAPVLTEPGALTVARLANRIDGHTYGVELSSQWKPTPWWQLNASYSWLKINMDASRSLDPETHREIEGASPTHQFHLRSFMTLPCNLEFDTMFYLVGNLPYYHVSSYARLDLRLGWRPLESLVLSLGVQNLLENRHPEFGDTLLWPASRVQRSVYGKLEWRY